MGASNFLLIDLLINLQSPESLFFRTEHSSLVANTFIPKKEEEKETFFWHQKKLSSHVSLLFKVKAT